MEDLNNEIKIFLEYVCDTSIKLLARIDAQKDMQQIMRSDLFVLQNNFKAVENEK